MIQLKYINFGLYGGNMDLKFFRYFLLTSFFVILTFIGFFLFIISLTTWKKDKSNKIAKRKMQISLVFFILMIIANTISGICGMYYMLSK